MHRRRVRDSHPRHAADAGPFEGENVKKKPTEKQIDEAIKYVAQHSVSWSVIESYGKAIKLLIDAQLRKDNATKIIADLETEEQANEFLRTLEADFQKAASDLLDNGLAIRRWELAGKFRTDTLPLIEVATTPFDRKAAMQAAVALHGIHVEIQDGDKLPAPPRLPLGKNAAILYEHLLSLPEHRAMTTPEILDWFAAAPNEIILSEDAFRDEILPELQRYGIKNRPRVGYF